jgi:hypothetical protein
MFLDEVRGSIFGQAQGALQMSSALRPPNLDGQSLSLPQLEARVVKLSSLGLNRAITHSHYGVGYFG